MMQSHQYKPSQGQKEASYRFNWAITQGLHPRMALPYFESSPRKNMADYRKQSSSPSSGDCPHDLPLKGILAPRDQIPTLKVKMTLVKTQKRTNFHKTQPNLKYQAFQKFLRISVHRDNKRIFARSLVGQTRTLLAKSFQNVVLYHLTQMCDYVFMRCLFIIFLKFNF